ERLESKGLHFFSDDDDQDGKRHHKVIIIGDGDVIVEREEGDGEKELFFEPYEGKPALELEAFEAFPNPADNQLTVRFTGAPAPITIMLLDSAGKQVYKEFIKDFGGKYDQQIGLQGLPEGLLLLTIEQEGRVFTEKLMIARQ
ncbi:MAG: T9SS type A sorting domain-containing protein, partial [Phaeodactylibacter sp.]|nr:T9SS type A sorting domain-containing protein [Phaeodactylibacter sp.]